MDDPARLNYHLNKLTGRFIRRADAGYELKDSGNADERLRLTYDERMEVVAVNRDGCT